jgi:hypothetical protein
MTGTLRLSGACAMSSRCAGGTKNDSTHPAATIDPAQLNETMRGARWPASTKSIAQGGWHA